MDFDNKQQMNRQIDKNHMQLADLICFGLFQAFFSTAESQERIIYVLIFKAYIVYTKQFFCGWRQIAKNIILEIISTQSEIKLASLKQI